MRTCTRQAAESHREPCAEARDVVAEAERARPTLTATQLAEVLLRGALAVSRPRFALVSCTSPGLPWPWPAVLAA
jgi:hypothetical protein